MKSETKIFAILIALATLIQSVCYGALSGTEVAKPGELVRITSDVEADWIVQPDEYAQNVYVDSSKKTLVLASPVPGVVYIFAATVETEGNAPKAFCWRLVIDDKDVVPAPDKTVEPKPIIDPVFPDTVIKSISELTNKELTAKEQVAFTDVLKSTIGFIEQGSITTTAGARETIRRNWLVRSATVSTDTETRWTPILVELFKGIDKPGVKDVKKSLDAVLNAMEGTK